MATNQKVGSSNLSGRTIFLITEFLASNTSAEFHPMFFGAEPNDNCTDKQNDEREESHGASVAHGMRHARLKIRAAGSDQHAQLIGQAGKKAAQRIRG